MISYTGHEMETENTNTYVQKQRKTCFKNFNKKKKQQVKR